ncbi:MAG: DUF1572 family protein [Bacteroidota bacterium]
MESQFLESVRKQFEYYKLLGEKTFDQLGEEQLFFKHNDESNSIATIVKHLHGNMMSRWTDFLMSDGEKEWRQRDGEFENDLQTKSEVLKKWNEGWHCLFSAIGPLTAEDLSKTVYIRNQGHTVEEAIIRQLAHYPYHVGQIVYVGKMIADANWTSLSIPRNKSSEYNSEKFSQPKHKAHFTDEYLKKGKDKT